MLPMLHRYWYGTQCRYENKAILEKIRYGYVNKIISFVTDYNQKITIKV